MLGIFSADISELDTGSGSLPLSQYRLDKLRGITNPSVYRQSLGVELLLIRALGELRPDIKLPLDIIARADGKPELRGGGIFFSLSHSRGRAACAVCDSTVGVDIQSTEPFNEALSRRFFTAGECEALLSADDRDYAFTRLWCLKESYLKYLGAGLTKPLASFEVCNDCGAAAILGDKSCRLWHFTDGEYHLAVCAGAEEKELSYKQAELL